MRKFRTMVEDAEELLPGLVGSTTSPSPSSSFGTILASRGWDERCADGASTSFRSSGTCSAGDMSLVGPRPEQVELVERYSPEERFRLEVKPGMTGPMQIYGRGSLTFEERLAVERDTSRTSRSARSACSRIDAPRALGRRGAY